MEQYISNFYVLEEDTSGEDGEVTKAELGKAPYDR